MEGEGWMGSRVCTVVRWVRWAEESSDGRTGQGREGMDGRLGEHWAGGCVLTEPGDMLGGGC